MNVEVAVVEKTSGKDMSPPTFPESKFVKFIYVLNAIKD
jgi:hypothetical protein